MVLVLFIILLVIIEPFKANLSHYSGINDIFSLLLASLYVSIVGINSANMYNHDATLLFYILLLVFGGLPPIYGSAIILYWIFSRRKFGFEIIRKFHALRRGYNLWTLG